MMDMVDSRRPQGFDAAPLGFNVAHVAVDLTAWIHNEDNDAYLFEEVANSPGFTENGGIQGSVQYRQQEISRQDINRSSIYREAGTVQLRGRRNEWAYSKPVVILDFVWNTSFMAVANLVLILTRNEQPRTPLRAWLLGYCLQCVIHIACVCCEYRHRCGQRRLQHLAPAGIASALYSNPNGHATPVNLGSYGERENNSYEIEVPGLHNRLVKRLESANTVFSFFWWIVGYYWTTSVAGSLSHESPGLYWLCLIFLAFDVFFVVFCVALACIIGIAICCCLPCLIAVLYAVTEQEGASDEEISFLPKHKFQVSGVMQKSDGENSSPNGGIMNKRFLSAEDAECCICLVNYEDEVELRELPCNHHFHCLCIDKWLRINATCPLCKYNIVYNCRSEEL